MALDPKRTVAELEELRELTGDENGAQRVAWTDTWRAAREWLRGKVASTGATEEIDEAGNQWFTLEGASEKALLIGGHIDSVPNGGWLDGCLNVMAGVEVLRRIAADGHAAAHRPARQLGRRGRSALRPVALRLVGCGGLDGGPGRAAAAPRRERDRAAGCAARARRRPRPRARRAAAARERGRLSRAAHRTGAGARVDGSAARRRARHVRGRAPPGHVDGPGGARRLDADGQAPRRAGGRGEARARDPPDRGRGGGGRRVHVGRRRVQAGDRDLRRRDGGATARPASSRGRLARAAALARAGRERALRGRRGHRRRRGSGSGRSSRSSSTRI